MSDHHEIHTNFWDHVEDLRSTLIRMMVIIGVGMVLMLCVYQPVFHVLTAHWQADQGLVNQSVEHRRVVNTTQETISFTLPEGARLIVRDPKVSVHKNLFKIPPGAALEYQNLFSRHLLIFGPLEGMVLTFKVCFWLSLALTSPLWGWVLMQFVIPGLKEEEKRLVIPFLGASVLCLCLGGAVAYFMTIPLSNSYLKGFNASIGQNAWSLSHYLDYTLILCLGHMIAFELGLILLMFVHLGWVGVDWLVAKRRHMIVVAFIVGAFLTPPDVPSQIMLALPLILLYEIAILYGKFRAVKSRQNAIEANKVEWAPE